MEKQLYPVLVALFFGMLLCTTGLKAGAQTKEAVSIKTLTLGFIFQGEPEPVEEHFRPLVEYAARKLSPAGNTKGMVVIAPNPPQLMKWLEEKRVDFYMESPYSTYLINRLGAARIVLRRWKGGMAEYHSLIFTAKGGAVAQLEDLRGKIIAFEDAGSTSGYFLPKLFLLKKGFAVNEKANLQAKVRVSEIGYIFANSTKNIQNLVLQKKVVAGAMSKPHFQSSVKANRCPAISYRCARICRSQSWRGSRRSSLTWTEMRKGKEFYDRPVIRQNLTPRREARKWLRESLWRCITHEAIHNRPKEAATVKIRSDSKLSRAV